MNNVSAFTYTSTLDLLRLQLFLIYTSMRVKKKRRKDLRSILLTKSWRKMVYCVAICWAFLLSSAMLVCFRWTHQTQPGTTCTVPSLRLLRNRCSQTRAAACTCLTTAKCVLPPSQTSVFAEQLVCLLAGLASGRLGQLSPADKGPSKVGRPCPSPGPHKHVLIGPPQLLPALHIGTMAAAVPQPAVCRTTGSSKLAVVLKVWLFPETTSISLVFFFPSLFPPLTQYL